MATTDFSSWLDSVDPEGTEEVYGLYSAVSEEESNGIFEVSSSQGKLFVKVGHVTDSLMITSPQAKALFLDILREKFMDGESDVESWYGYQRNMDNPKA